MTMECERVECAKCAEADARVQSLTSRAPGYTQKQRREYYPRELQGLTALWCGERQRWCGICRSCRQPTRRTRMSHADWLMARAKDAPPEEAKRLKQEAAEARKWNAATNRAAKAVREYRKIMYPSHRGPTPPHEAVIELCSKIKAPGGPPSNVSMCADWLTLWGEAS